MEQKPARIQPNAMNDMYIYDKESCSPEFRNGTKPIVYEAADANAGYVIPPCNNVIGHVVEKGTAMFNKGTSLRKRNGTTFSGHPCLKVETSEKWSNGQVRINGKYILNPDAVTAMTQEEENLIIGIWNDCTLKDHVHVEGRIPCSRSDGESKKPVHESDVQSKLFEIRIRRDDLSFQAYRCPDCGLIHIGRNPYVPKDRIDRP